MCDLLDLVLLCFLGRCVFILPWVVCYFLCRWFALPWLFWVLLGRRVCLCSLGIFWVCVCAILLGSFGYVCALCLILCVLLGRCVCFLAWVHFDRFG